MDTLCKVTKDWVAHAMYCRTSGSWRGRPILDILADLGFKTTREEVAPLIAQVIAEDLHETTLCATDYEAYCEYVISDAAPFAATLLQRTTIAQN